MLLGKCSCELLSHYGFLFHLQKPMKIFSIHTMLITSLYFQGIHYSRRTIVIFILSYLLCSPLNTVQICSTEHEALCLCTHNDGQTSVTGSVISNSCFLNPAILHADSRNYIEFLIPFSLQQMHRALSTSQGIHSSQCVIIIYFYLRLLDFSLYCSGSPTENRKYRQSHLIPSF